MPSAAAYANRLQISGVPGGFPGAPFLPGMHAPGSTEGARWVAERELPLWLVRTHEEKARREAAIFATRAAQEAERVRFLIPPECWLNIELTKCQSCL